MLFRSLFISTSKAILGTALGLAAGLYLAEDSPTTAQVTTNTCELPQSVQLMPTVTEAIDVEDIGDRLAERISYALESALERQFAQITERWSDNLAEVTNAKTASEQAVKEVTQEQEQAIDNGGHLVDAAIGEGYWTPQHAEQLRELMPRMSVEQRGEVLAKLADATNQGYIEVDDGPFAFFPHQ